MTLFLPKPNREAERAERKDRKSAKRKALYAESYRLVRGLCIFCLAHGKKTPATQPHHSRYGAGGRVEEVPGDIAWTCDACHHIAQADSTKRDPVSKLNGRPFVIWCLERLKMPMFQHVLDELRKKAK